MITNFIERIIFYKFCQKRHGWAEICRIVTYFSFLPTMTFFFLNVMVDENLSDFQLISFFTTVIFFFGKCHFFPKTSWLENFSKFPRTSNVTRRCNGEQIFHEKKNIMITNFIVRIIFYKFCQKRQWSSDSPG